MHMSDALVVPAVAATMYAASSVTAGYSIKKVKFEDNMKKIPVMGVMSAFVFAAQMINFTIPGTGSSGHFSGGLLLSVLLGPYAGFLSMISVLAIQCFLFADGGILALGCNIWNIAFYACFIGYSLIYVPIVKKELNKKKIFISSILASVVSLQLGAFSVVLQTYLSGITALSFKQFLMVMQPIHLAIGIMEGLITAAVIIFIHNTRPELLDQNMTENKMGFKQVLVILSVIVFLIGGGLSLAASGNPDGLEWSIEKVSGTSEIEVMEENESAIEKAERIQEKTAILPDYGFTNNDTFLGISFSGIFGAIIVGIVSTLCSLLFKFFKN